MFLTPPNSTMGGSTTALFWFPGLVRKGTYKFTLVRPCVRPCVRAFRSYSLDRSIFFSDFLQEVRSPYHFDDQWKKFGSKNFFDPPGGYCTQKTPFWLKNGLLSLYLPKAAINFSNFWYWNYPYGFLWENHSVYAGKISLPGGHFWPQKC